MAAEDSRTERPSPRPGGSLLAPGEPAEHTRTLVALHKGLHRAAEGRWATRIGRDWGYGTSTSRTQPASSTASRPTARGSARGSPAALAREGRTDKGRSVRCALLPLHRDHPGRARRQRTALRRAGTDRMHPQSRPDSERWQMARVAGRTTTQRRVLRRCVVGPQSSSTLASTLPPGATVTVWSGAFRCGFPMAILQVPGGTSLIVNLPSLSTTAEYAVVPTKMYDNISGSIEHCCV